MAADRRAGREGSTIEGQIKRRVLCVNSSTRLIINNRAGIAMTEAIVSQVEWVETRVGKKRHKRLDVDRNWFIQHYSVDLVPTRELAKMIGCVDNHVSAIADMLQIPRRGRLPRSIPHPKRTELDAAEVVRLYVEEQMAGDVIARRFGCTSRPVYNVLRAAGVKIRHHNDTKRGKPSKNRIDLDPDVVASMYAVKFNSAQTIADQFGVSHQVVHRILREQGIPRKPMGESRDMSGENSPNWRPWITPEEREQRRDMYQQKLWRDKVYARDEYACKCCGDSRGGNLHAHHVIPHSADRGLAWEVWNGLTMCETCHTSFHKQYGYTKCTKQDLFDFILARAENAKR